MAAVANTSAGPRNGKTDKFAELLVHRRHQIISPNIESSPRYSTDRYSDVFLWYLHQLVGPISIPLIGGNGKVARRTATYCKQNNSTCSCDFTLNLIDVNCQDVSVESIRDEFQRLNDPNIYAFSGYLSSDGVTDIISLPADFLGNTSVTSAIYIDLRWRGPWHSIYEDKYPNLVINPLAFRASQKSLSREFKVSNVDLSLQKDFNFLNGFDKLEQLSFLSAYNLTAFQYLPPLPSLQKLSVEHCEYQLNQIAFPDLSPAKLKNLQLWDNEISDEKADEIVAKLAASTSANSLEVLNLESNSLTRIPIQVGSHFPELHVINLGGNSISHISSSSLNFTSPYLELLHLSSNGLKTIENGSFVGKSTSARAISLSFGLNNRIIVCVLLVSIIGNFSMTGVDLSDNKLVVFEEGVFKEMLQQMVSVQPPKGRVEIYNSIYSFTRSFTFTSSNISLAFST